MKQLLNSRLLSCAFFALLIIPAMPLTAQQNSGWSSAAALPTARKEIANATVSLGDKIYVIGGVTPNAAISNKVEVYTPLTDSWTTAAPLPQAVWRALAVAFAGKIYVFGGFLSLGGFPFNPSSRVFEYDPAANLWTEKATMPTARGATLALAFTDHIYVIGGAADDALSTHEIYDPPTDSWFTAAPMPQTRSGLTGDVVGKLFYIAGGYFLNNGVVPRAELLSYDPASNTWSTINELAPVPVARVGMDAGSLEDKLYLFGGAAGTPASSHALRYDPASNVWEELEEMPQPFSFMGVGKADSQFYVLGGGPTNLDRNDAVASNRVFAPLGALPLAGAINPGHNGAWFNPQTTGQGFLIDVFPDIPLVFLAWFTWETVQAVPANSESGLSAPDDSGDKSDPLAVIGDDNHRWVTAQGPFASDTANLNVSLTRGGLFDDPTPTTTVPEGTITLRFSDCSHGTIDYDFTAAGVSGSVPIERVAQDNVPLCEALSEQQ